MPVRLAAKCSCRSEARAAPTTARERQDRRRWIRSVNGKPSTWITAVNCNGLRLTPRQLTNERGSYAIREGTKVGEAARRLRGRLRSPEPRSTSHETPARRGGDRSSSHLGSSDVSHDE